MSALANHKHELFAQGLAKGESASAAYRAAGYSASGNAADAAASRLLKTVKVQARLAELKERAAIKVGLTVADIIKMLDEDRELAHNCEQSGSAVSATLGMAKVLGMLKDKVEHSGAIAVDHTVEAEREIAEIFGPTPHLIEPTHG
jgi:phage terminase small subunit